MSRIDDFHDSFWIFAPLTSICVDRFLNKTNDTCVNSTENRFTKRNKYLCDIAALGPRLQDYKTYGDLSSHDNNSSLFHGILFTMLHFSPRFVAIAFA